MYTLDTFALTASFTAAEILKWGIVSLGALAIIMWVVFFILWLRGRHKSQEYPLERQKAIVLSKEPAVAPIGNVIAYEVVFLLDDNRQVTMLLAGEDAALVEIKNTGLLTFRGSRFKSFEK